jgi:hypothetical protein
MNEENMIRLEKSYRSSMFIALLFVGLLAVGGIGRVFAAAPGIGITPGTQGSATAEPTVISSSPSNGDKGIPTR